MAQYLGKLKAKEEKSKRAIIFNRKYTKKYKKTKSIKKI